jgi:hypothetical protein
MIDRAALLTPPAGCAGHRSHAGGDYTKHAQDHRARVQGLAASSDLSTREAPERRVWPAVPTLDRMSLQQQPGLSG